MEFLKERNAIQGDSSAPDFGTQMETAWDEIAKEVNSVNASGMERSKDELRKKYRNWKSDVKKKLAQVNRGRNLTGGGEIDYGNLDPMVPKLRHIITKEEVLGVDGGMEAGIKLQQKDSPQCSEVHNFIYIFSYYNNFEFIN